ncbi:helix-turn-helix domain-containing protein [Halarcobacter ebronensis]|uniref:AraC family transcriptional regulator n=1 Tax=Halarcobacter ebronensis TaxID=1462615 RepID=A0A4Q1ASR1_9BACT|nr:AraC family transcriptional regulator [Halarcobacter ebronensis]QKF82438.1 transcriptional regulator, AraC family [Halarcobacter ebronensis]RXK07541.1 AraC family transcriptional regulator [Halarcobacter ebronensis]
MKKISYDELIEIKNEIAHPFSRKISIANVKKQFGKGTLVKYDFGNGLAIYVRQFVLNQDIILSEESFIPGACFIFNLGEELEFSYKDKKKHLLNKNHFFIELASNEFYCETPLKMGKQYISYFIGIKNDLFLKLSNSISDIEIHMKKAFDNSYYILKELKNDTVQIELLENYKNKNHFEDTLKSIYLESKTMDLLHYSIQKTAKILNNSNKVNYDENRISSLERAKEIIFNEYNKNLSIKEISYRSAINQCYLKKDFKEYFGLTVYAMIQKRRLEVSKQLLQNDLEVKEVALKVGYKHSGNFIKIFQKHFGISPSKYKKTTFVK